MLKSRGDGRSTSTTTPSALANRVPEQISSSSYSFNQLHPILRPSGANPPRTPPQSTPSSQPSVSTTVPKDAHFPKLPSAPSVAPRSYLNSSSLPPPATKWAARNRKLVTAAEVVASSPADANSSSAQEEAAAKELENFALLVPVVSATPRNPARTAGHGGLRSTGSLVTLQQRQKAGSKLKHPHNGLYPYSSMLAKDSGSRLQSLTSQSKLQTTRKSASNSVSVSSARGKTSASPNSNDAKLGEGRMNTVIGKKDSNEAVAGMNMSAGTSSSLMPVRLDHYRNTVVSNSTPTSITSNVLPEGIISGMATISVAGDSSKSGKLFSRSSVERAHGIQFNTSTSEEIEPKTAEYRSNTLSEMYLRRAASSKVQNTTGQPSKATCFSSRNSGYQPFRSTQDVRISRDAALSPKVVKSNTHVSEEEVLELRRQAFAPSTESRTLRQRNSAYQSTRNSNPTLSRQNQTPSNSVSTVANNVPEVPRTTNSFQHSFDHHSSSHGRGKAVAFELDRPLASVEGTRFENHSGRTSASPRDDRAVALRSTFRANYKEPANRKGTNGIEESSCLDTGVSAANGWNETSESDNDLETPDASGLYFGENGDVSNPVPVSHPSMYSDSAAVNSSGPQTEGMEVSKYPSAWMCFDTNFSLNPGTHEVPTPKRRGNSFDGPSSRVLKGYHEESHIASKSSRHIGKDGVRGQFAKSPIFGSIGNGSDAWIPTIDGPRNEAISKIFLAPEAEAAEHRGSSRSIEERRDVSDSDCADAKKKVRRESAIDAMIRLQSNARSRMPDARTAPTSNASVVASGKQIDGIWATLPGFEADISAPKPAEDFELPPLPEPHDALFDSALKTYGGYPADEEVACDGPSQFQKRSNRHFNS